MYFKHKKLIAPILCVVICTLLFSVAYANNSSTENETFWFQYGQLEKEHKDAVDAANPIYFNSETNKGTSMEIVADDFSVSENEVSTLAAQMAFTGNISEEEAESQAIDLLKEKYSVYYTALNEGIYVDRQQILDEIEENKKAAQEADNYDEFKAFLEGVGMTNDEYWDSQYDTFLVYDTIGLYKQTCYNEFVIQNDVSDMNEDEKTEEFNKYYNENIQFIINNENIKVADEIGK